MRALLFPLTLLAFATPAAAYDDDGPGIAGIRNGDTVAFAARDFDGVALGTPATAEIHAGSGWAVRATGPADAIAAMRVRVSDQHLVIDYRDRHRNCSAAEQARARQVRFAVTLPRLQSASVGGSGHLAADRMDGGNVEVGGSGVAAIAQLTGAHVSMAVGGSGAIRAAGAVDDLKVSLGGSGQVDAASLRARTAEVSAAGSGSIRTTVTGTAKVSLVGSGHVDLGGGARCSVTKMGSGTVRCG